MLRDGGRRNPATVHSRAIPFASDPSTCAATALLEWREASGGEGRVFLIADLTINRIVKRAVERAEGDATKYGAQSLRAGLATTAAEEGVSLGESMAATRHRSVDVAAGYVRPTSALTNRAHRAVVERLAQRGSRDST